MGSRKSSSSSGNGNRPGPFASLSGGKSRSKKGKQSTPRFQFLHRLIWIVLLAGFAAAAAGAIYFGGRSLTFDMDEVREAPQRTLVYDRKGVLLGHVAGHGENRVAVPVSEVSKHFVDAILAREDSRFYSHMGVDFRGVARAIIGNLKAGGMDQGASTLTMQLARNTYGMKDLSINRKLLEVALALRIENHFTKDEILAYYINRVYFGSGLYGIERAAQGYFMKPASQLTLGESAMLAGVIRGPSLLNPFRDLDSAKAIQKEVLDRLVADKTITTAQATIAAQEPITLRPPDQRIATGSYPLQAVFDLLEDYLEPHLIETGGLKVFTTFDSEIQLAAEKALDSHLTATERKSGYSHAPRSSHKPGGPTKYLQGAVVSIDNRTGEVLALVGGRDFGESSFDRARLARRQVGSTFKPFVYAVAFDRGGLLPGAFVSDDPVRLSTTDGTIWAPKNSDGTFTGLHPAAIGLIRSRNTMSVRVGQVAGLSNVRSLARALKLGEIPESPVVTLGAFETTPFNLTSAYSTFPAKGVNLRPFLISRIEHQDGRLLFHEELLGVKIFPESVSWMTSDILGKVMDEGTGTGAREAGFKAPAYGKTGTTNDYHDGWFVGFTDKVTTGVWVGLDQPKTIMERGYGGTLALPVWTDVMKAAESTDFAAAPLSPPPGTQDTVICRECGLIGSDRTTYPYQMSLPPDLRPSGTCRGHGSGLFSSNNRHPMAFPIPGEETASGPEMLPPPGIEGGVERALRGIGRLLFGGGRR